FAPSSARRVRMTRLIPPAAPVTIATLPSNSPRKNRLLPSLALLVRLKAAGAVAVQYVSRHRPRPRAPPGRSGAQRLGVVHGAERTAARTPDERRVPPSVA